MIQPSLTSTTHKAARPASEPHRIAILAYQGLCLFEFALVLEVLGSRTDGQGGTWYQLEVCSLEGASVTASGGAVVNAPGGQEALIAADSIVVPGWRLGDVPGDITDTLQAAHAGGARIAAVCTGAFVLAAAGLLDGRRVTTHWKYADALAQAAPGAAVEPGVLYIDEGDVITSAGSVAGIDMLLHLLRRDHGLEASNKVARMMVAPPQRDGGQAQYIEHRLPLDISPALGAVLDGIRKNPAAEHSVLDMARQAHMSTRTFFRRFKAITGHTPLEWVLLERLRIAKEMLEFTDLTIDRIAFDAGFGAGDTFRHHFRRFVGTSPGAYRRTFQARLAS
ncbi:helix-turn-helix domain-containing protein [Kordiimonas sp.]|uniref:helix-turn-helix domain-containing protein n=1 Tax=Kordiimonas sp. TaxID=1970157 RepID=UPI003A942C30